MGKLTLLLLALLVWLQYSLWFGKNGIHDYSRVNDDVAAQQATNAKLKARNDQLFAEIDDLNGGQEAIEERARNELSMTKPGETFYRRHGKGQCSGECREGAWSPRRRRRRRRNRLNQIRFQLRSQSTERCAQQQ